MGAGQVERSLITSEDSCVLSKRHGRWIETHRAGIETILGYLGAGEKPAA